MTNREIVKVKMAKNRTIWHTFYWLNQLNIIGDILLSWLRHDASFPQTNLMIL